MPLLNGPTAAPHGTPAFTNCVRAFEEELDYLTRCLRRHGVSPIDAEDLVQDVFVIMCRRWSDFRPERPLRPWLAGIAFHVAKSHLRRSGRREVITSDIELEDSRPVAEERLMTEGARNLVLKVLSSLPERHRTALVMHDLDEMAVPEIAQTLGIPLASAYTRIRRARIAFANNLKRHEERALPSPRRSAVLGVEALFASERNPPAVSPSFRQRAIARARAAAAEASAGRWPEPSSASGPGLASSSLARIAEGLGLAALLGAAVVLVWTLARTQGRVGPGTVSAISAAVPAKAAGAARATDLQVALAGAGQGRGLPKLITAASPPQPGASLNVGLSGYWRFDDAAGAWRTHDASPQGNTCSLHRMKADIGWVTDAPRSGGLSLAPGGWLDCAQAPIPAGTGAETSVAVWIRIDQLRRYHGTFAVRHLVPGSTVLFYFGVLGSDLVLRSSGWEPAFLMAPIPKPLGRWIHVAFSRHHDGLTKLYIDGAVAAEARAQALAVGPATGPLLIGAALKRPNTRRDVIQHFYGAMDEMMIYDRALGDDEVAVIAGGIAPASDGRIGPVGSN